MRPAWLDDEDVMRAVIDEAQERFASVPHRPARSAPEAAAKMPDDSVLAALVDNLLEDMVAGTPVSQQTPRRPSPRAVTASAAAGLVGGFGLAAGLA